LEHLSGAARDVRAARRADLAASPEAWAARVGALREGRANVTVLPLEGRSIEPPKFGYWVGLSRCPISMIFGGARQHASSSVAIAAAIKQEAAIPRAS
jgi:hypothetical protein